MYIFILYSIFNITSSLGYEYFTQQLHIDYIFLCNIFNIGSSLGYVAMILFIIYTSITYHLHIGM